MSELKYLPREYWTLVKFSHDKHILVEGPADKRAFEMFIDELQLSDIKVDSAELLMSPDGLILGNREKIEHVCSKPLENLIGFVDREFREFEISEQLLDKLGKHMIKGCVVWSRGHSIENYCFDMNILRRTLRVISTTTYVNEALSLFETIFEGTISEAVILSLAAREAGLLEVLSKSLHWKPIRIDLESKRIQIHEGYWRKTLIKKKKVQPRKVDYFIKQLSLWRQRVTKAEFDTQRWLCHGHIGFALIWAVYSRSVFEASKMHGKNDEEAGKEAQKVLGAKISLRLNVCIDHWIRESISGNAEFPSDVFILLEGENPKSQAIESSKQ